MPSSTTNSSMNNNDRKRRGVSLSNTKKIRRSELINNSKNERPSRSSSLLDTQEYSLINRFSTLKQFNNSYENNNNDIQRDMGMF